MELGMAATRNRLLYLEIKVRSAASFLGSLIMLTYFSAGHRHACHWHRCVHMRGLWYEPS